MDLLLGKVLNGLHLVPENGTEQNMRMPTDNVWGGLGQGMVVRSICYLPSERL